MTVSEKVFRAHLENGPFQSGVARKSWRFISINWPHAIIAVSAATRKEAATEFYLRFELTDYPQTVPTAQSWDNEKNMLLEPNNRPCGGRVSMAFRTDWEAGQALYLPCDRRAIMTHPDWRDKHPSMIWSPAGDITQYLRIVYDLLNSQDYSGIQGS